MNYLVASAVFFASLHLLVSGTGLRASLVARLGEKAYMALFSLASGLGLAALIYAYSTIRVPQMSPLLAWRAVAVVMMFIATMLTVLGITTRGPTGVGGEKLLDRDEPARGIHRVTRHPMLWGFMLWAVIHMAFNPELVSLIFFGTFLLTAATGTISIDAKRRRKFGERWQRYEKLTSNLPFLAIAQGRNQLRMGELWSINLAIAVAIFVVLLLQHERLFGLPAY